MKKTIICNLGSDYGSNDKAIADTLRFILRAQPEDPPKSLPKKLYDQQGNERKGNSNLKMPDHRIAHRNWIQMLRRRFVRESNVNIDDYKLSEEETQIRKKQARQRWEKVDEKFAERKEKQAQKAYKLKLKQRQKQKKKGLHNSDLDDDESEHNDDYNKYKSDYDDDDDEEMKQNKNSEFINPEDFHKEEDRAFAMEKSPKHIDDNFHFYYDLDKMDDDLPDFYKINEEIWKCKYDNMMDHYLRVVALALDKTYKDHLWNSSSVTQSHQNTAYEMFSVYKRILWVNIIHLATRNHWLAFFFNPACLLYSKTMFKDLNIKHFNFVDPNGMYKI